MSEKSVVMDITNKCNSNCIMCTNYTDMKGNQEDISSQEYLSKIKLMDKEIVHITLTGGEPTIKKELFEYLHNFNKELPKAHILLLTNGRKFFYQSYAKDFMKQDFKRLELGIPICGSSAEINDAITRSHGSFNQTVQGIKNLIKLGAEIELRIVIHGMNYQDLPAMAKLIEDNFVGVKRVVLFAMEIQGNAFKNKGELLVRYKDITLGLDEVFNALAGFNVRLYHFPLCVLKPEHWKYAWRTLPERKIKFVEACDGCLYRKYCLGVLKTYSANHGDDEFKDVKERYDITETGNTYNPIRSVR